MTIHDFRNTQVEHEAGHCAEEPSAPSCPNSSYPTPLHDSRLLFDYPPTYSQLLDPGPRGEVDHQTYTHSPPQQVELQTRWTPSVRANSDDTPIVHYSSQTPTNPSNSLAVQPCPPESLFANSPQPIGDQDQQASWLTRAGLTPVAEPAHLGDIFRRFNNSPPPPPYHTTAETVRRKKRRRKKKKGPSRQSDPDQR